MRIPCLLRIKFLAWEHDMIPAILFGTYLRHTVKTVSQDGQQEVRSRILCTSNVWSQQNCSFMHGAMGGCVWIGACAAGGGHWAAAAIRSGHEANEPGG